MSIISNASPDELYSEYYKNNERFCFNLEQQLLNLGFKEINGKYNAWSYIVYLSGYLSNQHWKTQYKKSTFTSTGNLLLSSKYENLLFMIKWEVNLNYSVSDFIVKQSNWRNIYSIWFKNFEYVPNNKNYIIRRTDVNSIIPNLILSELETLLKVKEVYEIICEDNKLVISLRPEEDNYITILKSLISNLSLGR